MAARRSPRRSTRLRVLASRVAFSGSGVGRVYETRLRFPSGVVHTWTYLVKRPFVMVLALQGQRLVLVRQHRYPERRAWEVVKGGIERRESPLVAARRELQEETGFTARRWKQLGRIVVAPGYFNQAGVVFLARGLVPGSASPETNGEILQVALVPAVSVRRMITRGDVHDSTTLAGLLLAKKYFPL